MSQLEQHFQKLASQTLEYLKKIPTDASEEGHVEADQILSEFVRELGFTEISEAYEAIGKWYA